MENPIREAYAALAAAARTVDDEQAIDQLRQAINADPSLAVLMSAAARQSAICDLAACDEAILVE